MHTSFLCNTVFPYIQPMSIKSKHSRELSCLPRIKSGCSLSSLTNFNRPELLYSTNDSIIGICWLYGNRNKNQRGTTRFGAEIGEAGGEVELMDQRSKNKIHDLVTERMEGWLRIKYNN